MDDELLPIGRFARLVGLTVGALRHYDEEGVLEPAEVDPLTGYRRYRRDQAPIARAIAALRDLELSLPSIRALLESDSPELRAAVLRDERVRLEARTARLQRALHRLNMLAITADDRAADRAGHAWSTTPGRDPVDAQPATQTHHEEIPVPTPPPPPTLDPGVHRALAAGLFNRSWDLLEIEDRTARQDAELIDTAHASAWHWRQVGNAANEARGHWMLSRVYAVLGHGPESVYHARRANEVLEVGGEGIEDWDAASAAEAMARALVTVGDTAGAAEWKAKAEALLAGVADIEDRRVVEGDLATLPV
jgi:DNA-binding transcriptional MerR regulator